MISIRRCNPPSRESNALYLGAIHAVSVPALVKVTLSDSVVLPLVEDLWSNARIEFEKEAPADKLTEVNQDFSQMGVKKVDCIESKLVPDL